MKKLIPLLALGAALLALMAMPPHPNAAADVGAKWQYAELVYSMRGHRLNEGAFTSLKLRAFSEKSWQHLAQEYVRLSGGALQAPKTADRLYMLNVVGLQGWELVTSETDRKGRVTMTFKRKR